MSVTYEKEPMDTPYDERLNENKSVVTNENKKNNITYERRSVLHM